MFSLFQLNYAMAYGKQVNDKYTDSLSLINYDNSVGVSFGESSQGGVNCHPIGVTVAPAGTNIGASGGGGGGAEEEVVISSVKTNYTYGKFVNRGEAVRDQEAAVAIANRYAASRQYGDPLITRYQKMKESTLGGEEATDKKTTQE